MRDIVNKVIPVPGSLEWSDLRRIFDLIQSDPTLRNILCTPVGEPFLLKQRVKIINVEVATKAVENCVGRAIALRPKKI